MFRFFRLPALLCAPLLLSTRVIAQPLPDRTPLVGAVTDDKDRPIAGAYLVLRRDNDRGAYAFWGAATQTDAAGNFAFSDAEEGQYSLRAEAPGYAPLDGYAVTWQSGATPLRLKLMRLVDVPLKFSAPDGSPLANQTIYLRLRPSDPNGQISRTQSTDAQGNLNFSGVRPGVYGLWARTAAGYALENKIIATESTMATREITLRAAGALRLVLKDDAGRALGGATLSLSPATPAEAVRLAGEQQDIGDDYALLAAGNDRSALVTRDGDGALELGDLPPGSYQARLFLPGYTIGEVPPIEIKAGQTAPVELSVPARRAPTLTLDLKTPDDKPYVAGAVTLRILPLADNGALGGDGAPGANNADDLPFFPAGPGGRRATPDANGRIQLYPAKSGHYRIFVSGAPQIPGAITAEATPLDVTIGAQGATATVILPVAAK